MLQAEPEGAGGLTSRAKDLAQGEARAEGAAVEALGTPTWVLERTITAPRLCWPHTPPALFFLGLSVGSGPAFARWMPWSGCELLKTELLSDSSPGGRSILVSAC